MFTHSADVFLLVSDFNTTAQAFYRRLGYEQVGAIPGYVVPGITELIFRKRASSYSARARISPNSSGVNTIGLAFMLDAAAAFCARIGKSARVTP